jgi:hypothetical protein
MNAIALFLTLVLYGNPTCQDVPAEITLVSGQPYVVQTFQCFWRGAENGPSHTFEVWSPICDQYVEQPILISESHVHKGWAMNRFGEFSPSTEAIDFMHLYQTRCGVREDDGTEGAVQKGQTSALLKLRGTLPDSGNGAEQINGLSR